MEGLTIPYEVYSPYLYPWMCLNLFLAYWFLSNLFRNGITYCAPRMFAVNFIALSEDKKCNVISYMVQFFITTVTFVLQVYGGSDVLFQGKETTTQLKLDLMVLAMLLVVVLYIWELCYRQTIGWPLLVHHVVTIGMIQCVVPSYFQTQKIFYLRAMIVLGFQATTEQISFLALSFFRLSMFPQYQGILFYLSAIQTFALKTAITIAAIYLYIIEVVVTGFDKEESKWNTFWLIFLIPLLCILYAAQFYAGWILYNLAKRCNANARKMDQITEHAGTLTKSQRKIFLTNAIGKNKMDHQDIEDELNAFENAPPVILSPDIIRRNSFPPSILASSRDLHNHKKSRSRSLDHSFQLSISMQDLLEDGVLKEIEDTKKYNDEQGGNSTITDDQTLPADTTESSRGIGDELIV